ncbi:MAG TPA: CRISPR-associated protein Cas4 [Pyrinomonadaceae bacterium]|jgi:CRISPR-associated exonuclease Cas4
MSWLLLIIIIFLLLLAALLAYLSARRAAGRTGLPAGRIIYGDTGFPKGQLDALVTDEQGVKQEKALFSRRYGLTGRPDYLVRTDEGIVPVEAKSTRCPANRRPYDSHLMQLAAYCLLVEDVTGASVPYGLLRYSDCELRIGYTPELKEDLLALLDEMHEARTAEEVHRSHEEARRCAGCSMRGVCDEALAAS